MTHIAYLLLAHEAPARTAHMAQRLAGAGADVVIHYDRKSRGFDTLVSACEGSARIHILRDRVRCHWGDWSLVKATRKLVRHALDACPTATHFHLISGACFPIMPYAQIVETLANDPRDHIEAVPFEAGTWVQSGDQLARARHYHLFPERWWRQGFTWLDDLQRFMGVHRAAPNGIELRIGSQWWCLRRATLERIEALWHERPEIEAFFKWCWIPDEIVYQTLVTHVTPPEEINHRSPTLSAFSEHGQPFEFYRDHAELLSACDQFFARKCAPSAGQMRDAFLDQFTDPCGPERYVKGDAFIALKLRDLARIEDSLYPFWNDTTAAQKTTKLHIILCHSEERGTALGADLAAQTGRAFLGYPWSNTPYEAADLGAWSTDPAKRRAHWSEVIDRSCRTLNTDEVILCLNRGETRLLDWLAARYSVSILWLRHAQDADQLLTEKGVTSGTPSDAARALARETLAAYDLALEQLSLPQLFAPHKHGWSAALAQFMSGADQPNTAQFEERADELHL